jgi:hypothetical protein
MGLMIGLELQSILSFSTSLSLLYSPQKKEAEALFSERVTSSPSVTYYAAALDEEAAIA